MYIISVYLDKMLYFNRLFIFLTPILDLGLNQEWTFKSFTFIIIIIIIFFLYQESRSLTNYGSAKKVSTKDNI